MKPICICLFTTALLAWSAPVRSADPVTTQPSSLELGEAYVDGSFGFGIAPPLHCEVRRQKRMSGVADVEVVAFVNEPQRWSLTVRVSTTTRPLDRDTIVNGITENLAEGYKEVKVLRGDDVRIDAREGVRYAASFLSEGYAWLRQQAIVRTRPTEYYGLVLVTTLEDRAWAEAMFDKIVASFHIVRTPAMARRIEEGLQRGRLLLESVADGRVNLSERIIPESYMRFVLDGKEIGTVQISERAIVHNNRPGVQIHELGWLFNADGSTTHLQHDMHLTDDLTFEKWENRVYTLSPQQANVQRHLFYQLESGLRQDRKLIAAFMPRPNADELIDRVLDVEPTYASAAWHSLLPRVIDLRRRELYAFSSYDAERRGMVLRTWEVIGPDQVTIRGRAMQAYKLQASEGLLPPITEIHVDAKGRMLQVVAGQLEMVAAGKQDVLQQFGPRIAEAEATMKKYPLRQPTPARREPPPAPPAARSSAPRGGRP